MSANETTLFDQVDKDRLELTQSVRESIIRKFTSNGGIPDNKEDRALLIEVMNGSDRAVLSKAKIKAEDASSKNAADVANLIGDILNRISIKRELPVNEAPKPAPILSQEYVVLNPVEGETMIGVSNMTYEKFIGKNGE